MFRKFMLLAGVVGMISAAGAETIIPGGNVSGTWAAAGSPFLIMGGITVPAGLTLNIEPGVQVIFQGHYKLIVNGLLEAIGTEQDSIVFTAADTSVGWHGIRFMDAQVSGHLSYCIIQHGKANGPQLDDNCGGGVFCENSSPVISNCWISNNSTALGPYLWYGGGGLYFKGNSNASLHSSIIENNLGHDGGGIYCNGSDPEILQCNFTSNIAEASGGAIFCNNLSQPLITECVLIENFADAFGGGISCHTPLYAQPAISNCVFSGNLANNGGGLSLWTDCDAIVDSCEFIGNTAETDGGGIYCHDASPTISGNTFSGNIATGIGVYPGHGGGISITYNSSPSVCGNTIIANSATNGGGGGIYCNYSNPSLIANIISANSAYWDGGGICCDYSSPSINGNYIGENLVFYGSGGGIYCYQSSPVITANACFDNSAHNGGGIACLDHSIPIIENNLVAANSAANWGGGIHCLTYSNPEIASNTLVNNTAQYGGAFFADNSVPVISNSIAWGNTPYQLEGEWIVTYSCLQGGYEGIGNINANPLFITGPDGDYYLSQIAAGQSQQSPCVDAGDPASPMIDGTTRTDGVQDYGIVDMGYHYPALFPPPPPPPIDITLTPSNPPIIIPAGGGWFAFVITIDNNTDSTQTFDGWTVVQLPNGIPFPIIPPVSITLPASASLFRARDQYVPANAPAGNYLYRGFVGDHPWSIADSSSFPFTKLGSNRDWLGAEGWVCSGEPFPNEYAESIIHHSSLITHNLFPNPFNPSTVASYELRVASHVSLQVYDTAGRLVQTLVDGWREAGSHEVTFDGSGLAAGVYIYRLEAGEFQNAGKMILMK